MNSNVLVVLEYTSMRIHNNQHSLFVFAVLQEIKVFMGETLYTDQGVQMLRNFDDSI